MSSQDKATRDQSSTRATFWPFDQRTALVVTPVIFVGLLVAWGLFRTVLHFEDVAPGWVLLGIVAISATPIALLLLEGMATRGGSVAVGSVKIAITAGASRQTHMVMPPNAAPPGAQINDSGSSSILDALKAAKAPK